MRFLSHSLFNLDAALRYSPIVDLIGNNLRKNLKILEVGSGTNGISDFYSGFVIGLDSDYSKTDFVKNENIKHIKGSITKIPCNNNIYDFVVCLDVFEHINKIERKKAIIEMLRVTKKKGKIVIGFPNSRLSMQMEVKINNLYKQNIGVEHKWLREHREFGLPETKEIFELLNTLHINKKQINIFGNVNIYVWYLVHWLFTVHYGSFISRVLRRFYKPLFFMLDALRIPPFYRSIFIIEK